MYLRYNMDDPNNLKVDFKKNYITDKALQLHLQETSRVRKYTHTEGRFLGANSWVAWAVEIAFLMPLGFFLRG